MIERATGTIGTVTVLLAGIQDSAMLWERDHAPMKAAHSRYKEILRGAIEANGGYANQTIDDAFQATFPTAVQAVQAAIDAQLLFFTEQWPPSVGDLQVAMALHTGAIDEGANGHSGYSDPVHNRATSLLSAGHGGQVLLSNATQELLRDHLSQLQPTNPPGIQLLDLGEHRLKDLARPERIYQLIVPALPEYFPPLRTLDSLPNNLPRQTTTLIGREKQITEVITLLRRPDVSLVTLTGPAGTGKTRLSLEIGSQMLEEYQHGVWFVELATLSPDEHKLVPSTIAEALHVREAPGQAIIETLKQYLRDKQMLLVLDNFEQVTPAASQVASLLKAAPHLKLLVTSRIALRVYVEREYQVPTLSLPDRKYLQEHKTDSHLDLPSPEQIGHPTKQQAQVERYIQCEAVRLFVDRAQAVKVDFAITAENAPDIARVCARLDGLPLAIELAAARIRLFTPQTLLGRLSDRLKILTGGARDLPARQQTMRGAIEWSYDLLSKEDKQLFMRMAVFNGGRTLEAIETVCGTWLMVDGSGLRVDDRREFAFRSSTDDGNHQLTTRNSQPSIDVLDGVQSLLDKSLVIERDGRDGEPRYWMLETMHEYAREKLNESGEEEALGREHALYFMRLAEEAEPGLMGSEQAEWLNRLEDEHDNLRAALRWARQPGETGEEEADEEQETGAINRSEIGLRIAVAISQFWLTRGYFSEGREQLEGLLSSLPALPPLSPVGRNSLLATRYSRRAKAHNTAGILAHRQGEYAAARAALEQGLVIGRELDDKPIMARTFNILGSVADEQGDYPTAHALYEQSLALFRELGDKRGISVSLNNVANVAVSQGSYSIARPLYEQSLALQRELGNKRSISISHNNLGNVAYMQGDYSTAGPLFQQGLAQFKEIEDKWGIAISLGNLGNVAYMQGDYSTAGPLYEQSLALFQELGDKPSIALWLNALGGIAYMKGDYQTAHSLYEQGLALYGETQHKRGIAVSIMGLGAIGVTAVEGEKGPDGVEAMRRGTRLLGAAEAMLESIGAALEPVDRVPYAQSLASARSQLGDEKFESARQEGRAMSSEEAIEYAQRHPEGIFASVLAHEPAHAEGHEIGAERQRQVEELHIQVNQAKKARQVEAITGTEYFIELQARAKALLLARRQKEARSDSQGQLP